MAVSYVGSPVTTGGFGTSSTPAQTSSSVGDLGVITIFAQYAPNLPSGWTWVKNSSHCWIICRQRESGDSTLQEITFTGEGPFSIHWDVYRADSGEFAVNNVTGTYGGSVTSPVAGMAHAVASCESTGDSDFKPIPPADHTLNAEVHVYYFGSTTCRKAVSAAEAFSNNFVDDTYPSVNEWVFVISENDALTSSSSQASENGSSTDGSSLASSSLVSSLDPGLPGQWLFAVSGEELPEDPTSWPAAYKQLAVTTPSKLQLVAGLDSPKAIRSTGGRVGITITPQTNIALRFRVRVPLSGSGRILQLGSEQLRLAAGEIVHTGE